MKLCGQKAMLCAVALLLALAMALPAGAASRDVTVYKGKPAKYVFFFIGDGMGIPQRTAAEMYQGGKRLVIDGLPAQGVTTTYAADRFITGSAAAATALSAGQKTNIGMIGMAPDGRNVKTMAETARDMGWKVGIVSSVSIDHATPAAFYAHVPSRSMYYDIDVALAGSGFDFFGGGGLKDPTDKKQKSKNFQGDARDLMKKAGYTLVSDRESILALKPADGKVVAWNANLPDGQAMPYVLDNSKSDVTLSEFTSKAIEMLNNKKGFFLMVEGGKIDWACHANDAVTAVTNTQEFDKSVQVALDFYKKHPSETLIVVTGDHECGGLTLGFAGTNYDTYFDRLKTQDISFQKFTDEVLDLWKKETKEARFEDIEPTITHYFGLKFTGDAAKDPMVVEPYQMAMLQDAFRRTMLGERVAQDSRDELLYDEYDPLTVTITHILNNKAGLAWTSYKHTGVPVSTSAVGVGADAFNGYYDNTDVALKILSVMGQSPKVHFAENAQVKMAAN